MRSRAILGRQIRYLTVPKVSARHERNQIEKKKALSAKLRPRARDARSTADLRLVAQLLLEVVEVLAQAGHAPGDRDFVDKKDGPDEHPCSEEISEILHDPPSN